MKGSSEIGKEWYEQIEFLEQCLIGTKGQLTLDGEGKPADEEILAGCTIDLSHIMQGVQEAILEKQ